MDFKNISEVILACLIIALPLASHADDYYKLNLEDARCDYGISTLRQEGLFDCFQQQYTDCKIERTEVPRHEGDACEFAVYTTAHNLDLNRKIFYGQGWSDEIINQWPQDGMTWSQAEDTALKACVDSGSKDCKLLHKVCYDNGSCKFLFYGHL